MTPPPGAPGPPGRVAYLVSRYPALSHAFIEREVHALRDQGWQVDTVSVNPAGPDDLRSAVARADAASTLVLLADRSRLLRAFAELLLHRPLVALRAVARALRTGAPGLRTRVWQLFYLLEAVLLVQHLRRHGVRHVHVHLANNAADVARATVRLGRALEGDAAGWSWSMSMHGPTEFEDPVRYDLAAKVRDAAFVACITAWCRDALTALAPDTAARLHLVRMSVDADRYPPAGEERAARRRDVPVVLFVGRLVAEKGPGLLVEAARRLRDEGVPLRVRLVGSGPLADALAAQVAQHDLGATVELCGPRGQEELPALYADADLFCLPSFAEGLPVVLMEALSTELPVLTTRITGIPELVVDGQTGRLVEAGDIDALTATLRDLVADADLRARLGAAGRRRVLEEFLPEPNADRLAVLLRAAQRFP